MGDGLEEALAAAAAATDLGSVWDAIQPYEAQLDVEPRLAGVWMEALRATSRRPTLIAEAERVLEAWPGDAVLVGRACAALLNAAERPIDEPPLEAGPAAIAAGAAARCLGRLDDDARLDPRVGGRLHAQRAHALRLLGPLRADEALAAIDRALALEDRAQWRFERGLVHKHRRDFEAMLEDSRRALEAEPSRRPYAWNVAIAATALGRSEAAVAAWRAIGIEATAAPGALPLVEGMEPARVRLPTRGTGHAGDGLPVKAAGFEIVWAQPLSPCHGVLRSPTQRDAVADFGDVVLWDGAPVAVTEHEGRRVPCFPLLTVLKPGDERRFRFLAMQQRPGQIDALGEGLPDGALLYAHGERVERLCPRCAAGDTMVRHEHLPPEEHRLVFGKLLAPGALTLEALAEALEAARRANPGVLLAIPELFEALGDSRAAGKHHQRWGAIERTAQAGGGR